MSESETGPVLPGRILFATAFFAGGGTMLLEVLAPRIMQPYFGASTFVWTNVIGVILLAMALGYNLGGKLAERGSGARRIAWTLSIAAVLTLLVNLVFAWFAEFLLPSAEALADSSAARSHLEFGSLVAAICLFCPPVLLLATLTPQIIQEVVRGGQLAGRAAGRVFMWGTLGSLLGTFLPTYWLVPSFGTRASLYVAAGSLFVPAATLFYQSHRRKLASGVAIVLVGLVLTSATTKGPLRPALAGEELLDEQESRYQYLRLVRKSAVEDPSVMETKLCIDEGLLDFHSVDSEGKIGTLGKYYDYFALLPTLFPADRKLNVLVLGSGMGTMSSMLCAFWDDRIGRVIDVEIDPGVLELARRFGPPQDERIVSLALDARAFVEMTQERFDIIIVDAYARQVDIPFHMATVEFFELLQKRLVDDGIVALNVSSKDPKSQLTQSLLRSMTDGGFKNLETVWVRYWGNRMLWGSCLRQDVVFKPSGVPAELKSVLEHALRTQEVGEVEPNAVRLTDDFAPVELLTRESLEAKDR